MPAIQAPLLPAVPAIDAGGGEPRTAVSGNFNAALSLLLVGGATPLVMGAGGGCRTTTGAGVDPQGRVASPASMAPLAAMPAITVRTDAPTAVAATMNPPTAGAPPQPLPAAQTAGPPEAEAPSPMPEPLPEAGLPIESGVLQAADNSGKQASPAAEPTPRGAGKPRRKPDEDDATMAHPSGTATPAVPLVPALLDAGSGRAARPPDAADQTLTRVASVTSAPQRGGKPPTRVDHPDSSSLSNPTASPIVSSGKPMAAAAAQAPSIEDAASAPTPAAATPLLPAPTTPVSPATTQAARPGTSNPPASVATQVEPALIAVAQAPNGVQRLTLRLQPAELGTVEVRVDRSAGMPARVDITVQRPETLTLLLRDQPQLQHALNQAGLPADGRSLTLHIAPSSASGPPTGMFASLGQGSGHGQQAGNGGQPPPQSRIDDDEAGQSAVDALAPQQWLRAGLDITA